MNLRILLLCFIQMASLIIINGQEKYPKDFRHINYTHGLSNNRVLCTIEDDKGFMWFGTTTGLNRYDGYQIKKYQHIVGDPTSLIDNMILAFDKDGAGNLWISTSKGIVVFNTAYETFTRLDELFAENDLTENIDFNLVKAIDDNYMLLRSNDQQELFLYNINSKEVSHYVPSIMDSSKIENLKISNYLAFEGLIYIVYSHGEIHVVDFKSKQIIRKSVRIVPFVNEANSNFNVYIDHLKRIWIYSSDYNLGLFCINEMDELISFNTSSTPALNSNIVAGVIQDESGNFWIGTDHGGLNILNSDLNRIDYVSHDRNIKTSISQNVITHLYKSSDQIIWFGTFKEGVNFYHPMLFKFPHFENNPDEENSLPYNDVNCFAEDQKGNLYIGTNGNGVIYFNRKNNVYIDFLEKEIGNSVIVSLLIDKEEKLWIGTYYDGLLVYDGYKVSQYLHNANDDKTICDNRIWDVFEDSKQNIWIGTLGGGLDLFDRKQNVFVHYNNSGVNSVHSNFVMDINEDHDGNLWFATDKGAYCLDKRSSRFVHYSHEVNNESSLSSLFVSKVFIDAKSNVWLGTRDGLNLFNKKHQSFYRFTSNNGLPDNAIMGILESEQGELWVSTSSGLCNLIADVDAMGNYKSHHTINFNESDGLQSREFNAGSAYKTRANELIFGGANGFNLFKPVGDFSSEKPMKVFINGLKVFGQDYDVLHAKENIPGILNDQEINLSHKESIFSVEYVVVDHVSADKIKYRYKLEGFNDQWIHTDWNDRKATFTNLSQGTYRLIVQASVFNSDWATSENSVTLVIHPPWYRTWLAYVFYYLLLMLIVYFLRRAIVAGERIRYQKEEALKETGRQQALNELKNRFFTNVSHEFRTPLTLIITPLDKLLKSDIKPSTKKHLELMSQNAKRLLHLVNQLLDFRKAEEDKLDLNLIFGNIVSLIDQSIDAFQSFKDSKHIKLEFLPEKESVFMRFDKDKIEKIITNLLSNAFKFTPEGGRIEVSTQAIQKEGVAYFEIKVKDSGEGIPFSEQAKVFERFYQAENAQQSMSKGSGIGLSLVNDFVVLHGGTVGLESEVSKGSTFSIELPINSSPIIEEVSEALIEEDKIEYADEITILQDGIKQILLVEDNAAFRFYLKDSLNEEFRILEASNGKEAILLMETENIDLVVSDVMMPEMDGIALCDYMKSNEVYSHIPIILLTAKSTPHNKLEGLQHGADEYITKPFNLDILLSRIGYLLALRERFIKQYQESFTVNFDNKGLSPLDEKFLDTVTSLIQDNISNAEFSVDKMSKELGMSRANLYKKLIALTGKKPIDLIRLMRFKKATELLLQGELNVSEITYEVGFNDPKYFSKQFKNEFGVLPSKYKEQQRY